MNEPITFNINTKAKRVDAFASGELKFDDIVSHYQILFNHSEFQPGLPAIYDFSNVTRMIGNLTYFEKIAKEMGDSNIVTAACQVAIIVAEDNSSMNIIFNAYSQMMDYTLMTAKVFHDKESALAWISKGTNV